MNNQQITKHMKGLRFTKYGVGISETKRGIRDLFAKRHSPERLQSCRH